MDRKIGKLLIKAQLINETQLAKALEEQKASGGRLREHLVALGYVTEEDILECFSRFYGVQQINLKHIDIDESIIRIIHEHTARKYQVIPVSKTGGTLTVAMTDPFNVFAMDEITFITGYRVEPVVASEEALREAIDKYYGTTHSIKLKPDNDPVIRLPEGRLPDGRLPDLFCGFEVPEQPSRYIGARKKEIGQDRTVVGQLPEAAQSDPSPAAPDVERLITKWKRSANYREQIGDPGVEGESPRIGASRASDLSDDQVDCSVFAPPSVPRRYSAMVQVFLHRPEERAKALAKAQELDQESARRATKSLLVNLIPDARVQVHLSMRHLIVHDPMQELRWQGRPEAVQFDVEAPAECPLGTEVGTVMLSVDGVPVGHVKFKLSILRGEESPETMGGEFSGDQAVRYRRAFVSYASADRNKVLARLQMLRVAGIDFFQDLLDLEPGQRWEFELYREIDRCDLFLLFWSSAAKASHWVMQEVRYALRRQGNDETAPPEIRPIILEGPPIAEPPQELAHLHFNDHLVYLMTR